MKLPNPSLLQSLKGMELIAREMLGGYQAGLHPNVLKGSGQEFSQYRSYQPGDDLRQLDWKMYARSDRYYVRESEVETNVTVRFLVDTSASMLHQEDGLSKLDYARMLMAGLGFLAVGQGDEVALMGINDQKFYRASRIQGRHHLPAFWKSLVLLEGKGRWPGFDQLKEMPYSEDRKELCLVFSDMYEYESEILTMLRQLRSRGNEVVLFHLMGRKEYDFDYKGSLTFEDLESGESLQVNVNQVKTEYLRRRDEFLEKLRNELLQHEITHQLALMDENGGEAIRAFLNARKRL
jgi:uncharacterized protein (DUF58 family)